MRRVVSVWLPTLATDRLRRHGNASVPADKPLITATHDGRRQVVAAADRVARSLGLYPGMAVAQAQAMVPGLPIAAAEPKGDARALDDLAAWCLRYAPLTAPDRPDGIWIEAAGVAHLFGGEAALLADLVARLARGGVTARAAIADTPGTAWAVARYAERPITVVAPSGAADALRHLPIAALRLPEEVITGLARLGFERIDQLTAAPRPPLALRFGPGLMRRLDQAFGRLFEPIEPVSPSETVSSRLTFPEPLLTSEALTAVVGRLTHAVCAELERREEGARQLDLVFERVDRTLQAIRIGTARPSRATNNLRIRILIAALHDHIGIRKGLSNSDVQSEHSESC